MLAGSDDLGGVMVPKSESAAGFDALNAIAAAKGVSVSRLAIGHINFMADTGIECDEDQPQLAPLPFAAAMATRLSGLAPAIDGVTSEVDNPDRLQADVQGAIRFGLGGKLCIHPRQVHLVHAALTPPLEVVSWAKRVI